MEIVDVVVISDTTANVTWNPPIQPNGIITGYEVKYSVYEEDSDNKSSILATTDMITFNITDLCKLNCITIMYMHGT